MVRLTPRKPSSNKVALPISRTSTSAIRRTSTSKIRQATPIKKKAAPSRKKSVAVVRTSSTSPIVAPKIKSLINELHHYAQQRLNKYGSKDAIALKLKNIHSSLGKELKKINIINPSLTMTLSKVSHSIRGASNVPQAIRLNPHKLNVFLRDHVRASVIRFLSNIKTQLSPIVSEFRKFEAVLNAQTKKAKGHKIHLKVDPSLTRRFNTLNGNISRFKTRWYKTLNTMSLHGNKSIQVAAKGIKKELDDMQRSLRRNLAILSRHSKAKAHKPGYKTQQLLSATQAKNFESKWNQLNKGLDQYKTKVAQFSDQLKAVKVVK